MSSCPQFWSDFPVFTGGLRVQIPSTPLFLLLATTLGKLLGQCKTWSHRRVQIPPGTTPLKPSRPQNRATVGHYADSVKPPNAWNGKSGKPGSMQTFRGPRVVVAEKADAHRLQAEWHIYLGKPGSSENTPKQIACFLGGISWGCALKKKPHPLLKIPTFFSAGIFGKAGQFYMVHIPPALEEDRIDTLKRTGIWSSVPNQKRTPVLEKPGGFPL